MQHMTVADKSLMMADSTAELILEYAALLGKIRSADTVRVRAIGADGGDVVAGLLLNPGTVLVIESSPSTLPEPDNREVEEYIRGRMENYTLDDAAAFAAPESA